MFVKTGIWKLLLTLHIDFSLLTEITRYFVCVKPPKWKIRPFLFCKTISVVCFGKEMNKYCNNVLKWTTQWTRVIYKNVTKMQAN